MNLTVQDLLRQEARIQNLDFNISEMKLSITSLYITSDTPKYDIIWTENSDVIDSFISEILEYKSWILASWRKRSWTVRLTLIWLDLHVSIAIDINVIFLSNSQYYPEGYMSKIVHNFVNVQTMYSPVQTIQIPQIDRSCKTKLGNIVRENYWQT